VLSAVLRQFRWPLIVGLMMGTGLAAFGSSLLRVILYGVNNLDPVSYAAAVGLLVLIALASMILPAVRALRMDLAAILHYE
jgi:ABC-type antimicrobial peptide transport system permease subunit